nr:U3 small nucleolar RNA-associated protein 20-like isoform X1 [Coffea arabica]
MATPADARAVKSLNTGEGSKKFVYKSNVQQIAEIDINVYRSLDPVKAEPSEGSTFFRDCLVEWRELNTAEDFISFYQEMFPLVQTLPQIILQRELIVSKLLSRLQIKSRLSLEPILRYSCKFGVYVCF